MAKKNKYRCIEHCADRCVVKSKSEFYPCVCVYDSHCHVSFELIEKTPVIGDESDHKPLPFPDITHKGIVFRHTLKFHGCDKCDLKNTGGINGTRYNGSGYCRDLKMGYSRCGDGVWKKVTV